MINGYYNDPMRAYEYEESGKCYRGYGEWSPDEVDCTSRTLERVIFLWNSPWTHCRRHSGFDQRPKWH